MITTSRADYGIYRPLLRVLESEDEIALRLLVSGAHLSPEFGMSVRSIEEDGFTISDRIEIMLSSDTAEGTAKSIALAVAGFAQSYSQKRPDILIVLGDRFEMHAAALAALAFRIPVAHIHGGELSEGAIDELLRHSLTKLSHLHFPSTDQHALRIRQLGEEEWRIHVSGAPSLDNLRLLPRRSRAELEVRIGDFPKLFALVTFHPATLESGDPAEQARAVVKALELEDLPAIITMPNADAGGRAVRAVMTEAAQSKPNLRAVENLGSENYFSLMALASVMVGNSSSGIIEAASFRLPVVNIGSRQQGRIRARNVIDVPCETAAIRGALRTALTPAFKASLDSLENPYGDGHAAERIVDVLRNVTLDDRLLTKRFRDVRVGLP